jgi:hypothetical protein
MVRTLKEMLRSTISHRQTDWTDKLAALDFAYNNSIHPSTSLTPFELDLGLHPRTPYSLVLDTQHEVQTVEDFLSHLEALQHQALEALEKARQQQSANVDKDRPRPRTFQVGDLVLLSHKHLRTAASRSVGSDKLRAKYSGPFRITKKVSPTAYQLDLPANIKIHPTINIEYLKEYHSSPAHLGIRDAPSTPDPVFTEEGIEEYEVERILDHRKNKKTGAISYLVAWRGYALHDATWEPYANLQNSEALLSEYWKEQKADNPPVPRRRAKARRGN